MNGATVDNPTDTLYVEAPQEYTGKRPSVFLAGGISNCDQWQQRMSRLLAGRGLVILNPRRRQFSASVAEAQQQIAWEYRHLRRAWGRLFWFPPQTVCPITLFELGAWSAVPGPLWVGVDPEYSRRLDVQMQLQLARPDVSIASSLEELASQVPTLPAKPN